MSNLNFDIWKKVNGDLIKFKDLVVQILSYIHKPLHRVISTIQSILSKIKFYKMSTAEGQSLSFNKSHK